MHKKLVNEIRIDLDIIPEGPILIAEGKSENEKNNEIHFVRDSEGPNGKAYIPGSSLKGVIRSYCEKISHTLGIWCCNPLLNRDEDGNKPDCSCSKKVDLKKKGDDNITVPQIYKALSLSCYVCKLFGSTGIASRIYIEDACLIGTNTGYQKRTNISIDRKTGGVKEGPFTLHTVKPSKFTTQIYIRNFELWQIGLLGLALRDLHDGHLRIGFAKSRGLGKMKADIREFRITYPFHRLIDKKRIQSLANGQEKLLMESGKFHIYGVGSMIGSEGEAYGYNSNDKAEVTTAKLPEPDGDWLNGWLMLKDYDTQVKELLKVCVEQHWLPLATKNQPTQEG
jgi:CRISPR-associated RAMP protein (TIGR02581 family)